ncbi:hypothetical protein Tco_1012232 [Tanacetum coccineum]
MGKSGQAQDYPKLLSGDGNVLSTSEGRRRDEPLIIEVERRTFMHRGSNGFGHHSPYRIQWRDHLATGPDSLASKNRPGIRKICAVPSTAHEMLKFPVEGGTVTLQSSRVILMECAMISRPSIQTPSVNQVLEEKINIAIHPEYPEQTIAIGSTLTEKGRKELCSLLKQNLDIFAWKPADMTGVPRNIAKHRLNIWEGYSPVRQKKRGQAPERNKIIQEEVEKLVDAGIMKEEKILKSKRAKTSQNRQETEKTSTREEFKANCKSRKRQQEKKVNEDPIEVKGLIMTSFQSSRVLLDVLKSKDQR